MIVDGVEVTAELVLDEARVATPRCRRSGDDGTTSMATRRCRIGAGASGGSASSAETHKVIRRPEPADPCPSSSHRPIGRST
jgi:hypothetical protein